MRQRAAAVSAGARGEAADRRGEQDGRGRPTSRGRRRRRSRRARPRSGCRSSASRRSPARGCPSSSRPMWRHIALEREAEHAAAGPHACMSIRRIGILGGTFDPIHWGHLEAAFAAETALSLDARAWWCRPTCRRTGRSPHASSFHRFAMVSLAVAGRAGWRASDLELRDESQSYTSATLRASSTSAATRPSELFFILGCRRVRRHRDLAELSGDSRPRALRRGLPARAPGGRHPAPAAAARATAWCGRRSTPSAASIR